MTQLWHDVMTQLQPKSPDDVTAQLFRFVPPAALCFDDLFHRGSPYLIIAVYSTSD